MFRPLASLRLNDNLLKLLENKGFFYVEDIESAPGKLNFIN